MFIAAAVVSVILALAVAGSGAAKLTGQERVVTQITGLGVPRSWFPLLAAAELAGAVGLLIGLWVAPLGIAAGVGVALYFLGALITHVRVGDREVAPAAVLLLLAVASVVLRVASA